LLSVIIDTAPFFSPFSDIDALVSWRISPTVSTDLPTHKASSNFYIRTMAKSSGEIGSEEAISPEASKRICDHMNDDHMVSVYAMAKELIEYKRDWKLTGAKLKRVTAYGCEIQAITCSGELCEMLPVVYPFRPALKTAAQSRKQLVKIHQKVCSPKLEWLLDPLPLGVIGISIFLAYGTLILGIPELKASIENDESMNSMICSLFGSPHIFSQMVKAAFWFTVVIHSAEADYAIYKCRTTLKLDWITSMFWFATTCLVGYPVLGHLIQLIQIHDKSKAAQKAKLK
jgi:uncharacterized protein with PQ loop repeat